MKEFFNILLRPKFERHIFGDAHEETAKGHLANVVTIFNQCLTMIRPSQESLKKYSQLSQPAFHEEFVHVQSPHAQDVIRCALLDILDDFHDGGDVYAFHNIDFKKAEYFTWAFRTYGHYIDCFHVECKKVFQFLFCALSSSVLSRFSMQTSDQNLKRKELLGGMTGLSFSNRRSGLHANIVPTLNDKSILKTDGLRSLNIEPSSWKLILRNNILIDNGI